MKKNAVERLFDSLYKLTDIRQIFRQTSPTHELNDEQKKRLEEIINGIEENLDYIREEMVK